MSTEGGGGCKSAGDTHVSKKSRRDVDASEGDGAGGCAGGGGSGSRDKSVRHLEQKMGWELDSSDDDGSDDDDDEDDADGSQGPGSGVAEHQEPDPLACSGADELFVLMLNAGGRACNSHWTDELKIPCSAFRWEKGVLRVHCKDPTVLTSVWTARRHRAFTA